MGSWRHVLSIDGVWGQSAYVVYPVKHAWVPESRKIALYFRGRRGRLARWRLVVRRRELQRRGSRAGAADNARRRLDRRGASSRASSAISSTRHYCRRRKRLVLVPLVDSNAPRWFAVRKAQGPKLALGAAASVRLTGFWLALACGCSRSCPLMVARADARSAGHGRTTHSTKLVCRGGASL